MVAEQLYLRDTVQEATDYLSILGSVVEDKIIDDFLDLQVSQESLCPPDSVKLPIERHGVLVVASDCIDGSVEKWEEEGEVVEVSKECDVLLFGLLVVVHECGVVEIAHGG